MGLRGLSMGAAAGVIASAVLVPALYLDLPAAWIAGWTPAPAGLGVAGAVAAGVVTMAGGAAAVRSAGARGRVDALVGGGHAGFVAALVVMVLIGGTAATIHALGPIQAAILGPPPGEDAVKALLADAISRTFWSVAWAWLAATAAGVALGALGGLLGARGAPHRDEDGVGVIEGLVGTVGVGWGLLQLLVVLVGLVGLDEKVALVLPEADIVPPLAATLLATVAYAAFLSWRALGTGARRSEAGYRAYAVLSGLLLVVFLGAGGVILAVVAPGFALRPAYVAAFAVAVALPLGAGLLAGRSRPPDSDVPPTGASDAVGGAVLAATLWTAQFAIAAAPGIGIALAVVSHIPHLMEGGDAADPAALVHQAYLTSALWLGGAMVVVAAIGSFALAVAALFAEPVTDTAVA